MAAKTPEDAHRQLYESDAVLCDSGGWPVTGLDAIRRGYAAMLRSKPQVKVQTNSSPVGSEKLLDLAPI